MSYRPYGAVAEDYGGDLTYLDALCGLGARGLRVANELDGFENIILNDANPNAIQMAKESSEKNNLENVKFSNQEACSFLSEHSETGMRAMAADVDPFGSPAKYFDCAVRSVAHGGLLSATATDLQVLRGLFNAACVRRYGGVPIRRAKFGMEIGIRLMLGCLGHVCARIDRSFEPLFVHCDMHYYRIYVKVKNHPASAGTGYVYLCTHCGNRGVADCADFSCPHCMKDTETAGPIWIGRLFNGKFTKQMRIHGTEILRADIENDGIHEEIANAAGRKVNAIVCDLSPQVIGSWSVDHARQISLNYSAAVIMERVLAPKGNAVFKVFDGPYASEFGAYVGKKFAKTNMTKPSASRKASSEVYAVCLGYHG